MRESSVETKLRLGVRRLGGTSYKLAPTTKGLPDRLVILPGGRIHFVELKADGGRLAPAQLHIHTVLRDLGANVVTLEGPDEVQAWLDERNRDNGNM